MLRQDQRPGDASQTALTTSPLGLVRPPRAAIAALRQRRPPSALASTQHATTPRLMGRPHTISPLLTRPLVLAGPTNPAATCGVDSASPSEDVRYIPVHVGTESPIL